ncbi:MAG: cupin domain-containing protein [Candidatus Sumerlaeota bacterium]
MGNDNDIPVYPKAWGEEHWIVNNLYCGKKLVLKKGYRCSIHYHKLKDETFYVIAGRILLELDDEARVLEPGDKVHVAIGQKHRFTGLERSEMIEFSTHHEEEDSYRDSQSGKIDLDEFELISEKFSQ